METPAFNAIAARGLRFRRAYATVPETLPSHSSIMTGLYPAGHGVHENARALPADVPGRRGAAASGGLSNGRIRLVVRARAAVRPRARVRRVRRRLLEERGVSDATPRRHPSDRRVQTTDAASRSSIVRPTQPRFLWVHYNDPHAPYTPPGAVPHPIRKKPYLGEVAAMDAAARTARPGVRADCRVRRRSSSSPITARVSAIMARRSTAARCTRRRCTCRWCWWARAIAPGVERRTGEHATRVLHDPRLGRARRREHTLRQPDTRPRSCSARR